MDVFCYDEAFSRNIGWVSPKEQLILKNKTVAIAGMGGVGGFHLLTLCRLGIENFHIADPDHFELANFNRQVGATLSSLHQAKNQTLLEMAKNINPQVNIKVFDSISKDNVVDFLTDCDLYLDGMDFFAVEIRELLFKTSAQFKIPAITAAPMGMGVNYLIFDEYGMSFEEYFQWDNKTENQKLVNFAIGLAPKPLHLSYLADATTVDFDNKKGPSTIMSCMLCAGVAGVQALKILLNRGKIYSAPYYYVFDPYVGKFKRGYLLWGNKNPIQRFKQVIINKILAKKRSSPPKKLSIPQLSEIEQIIDLARWAPSGDNTQPWKFKLISKDNFSVFIENPLKDDIYDFDGKPTLLSVGCLIESIRLAANKFAKKIHWEISDNEGKSIIKIQLLQQNDDQDPLHLTDYIEHRSVDRTYYQKLKLPAHLVNRMNSVLDSGYQVTLFTDTDARNQIIRMNMLGTQIRLVLEEAHRVHQHVIQWDVNKTDYGIPYSVTGLSKGTTAFTKTIFNNWSLMYFINHTLGGAIPASLELDYFPGKSTPGFFIINAPKSIDSMSDKELIESGMQIQRIWLYLTQMNLVLQPCFVSIIISYYVRNKKQLTTNIRTNNKIIKLTEKFKDLGFNERTIFIARVGYPKTIKPEIRSNRLDLDQLIISNDTTPE